MKRFHILFFFIFISFSLTAQERIYISWFEVSNINKAYQISSTKVFRTFILEKGKFDAVVPPLPDSLYRGESLIAAQENAKKLNAAYIVTGELNKIGSTVVVNVQMYIVSDLSRVWNATLRAKTPDDLEPILSRMAKSLGTDEKPSDNDNIYNLTDYESRELKKVNSNSYFGVGLGGAAIIKPNFSGGIPAGMSLFFSYDTRNIILDFKAEAYFRNGSFYLVSIDALYPMTNKANGAFLGGGLGIGGMAVMDGTDGAGLIVSGNAGYLINRNANTCLRLSAKPFVTLFDINRSVAFGAIFNVSLLFGR